MDREQWLAERKTGLGGSDSAAALGQSAHKTQYELFLEKKNVLVDDPAENKEVVAWGRLMEDVIANRYAEVHGVSLRRRNGIIRHPKYPWMIANVDRVITGQHKGFEAKNVGYQAHRMGDWGPAGSDEVPVEYALQCHHYMTVLDYPVFDLAACVGGNTLAVYTIEADAELREMIIENERVFWEQHVLANVPPPIDFDHASTPKLLKRLHPGTNGERIVLDEKLRPYVETLLSEMEIRKQADAAIETCKARIAAAMEDAAVGVVDGIGEVHRKLIKKKGFTVDPTEYVDMRIKHPKEPA